MSLSTQTIASLFNGVSQQPATLRLPSQAAAQVNVLSTVADGVRKRPAMQNIAKLTTADWASAFTHSINRDTTERYELIITPGDLRVFDTLTGTEKTVTWPQRGVTWTVATAVTTSSIMRPTVANGYIYHCTGAGTTHATTQPTWGTTVGGTTTDGTATWTCHNDPIGLASGNADENFAAVTVADYTFIVNKSVTVALDAAGADAALPVGYADFYSPWTTGTLDDNNFYNPSEPVAILGSVQTFQDLPSEAPDLPVEGDVWRITGDTSSGANFSSYYVRRTGGVWKEYIGIDLQNRFREHTMPWALRRNTDGTFTLSPFLWNVRKVGDEKSNAPPSFVGKTIEDVFFYKNRLAFIAGENVIFSGAGDFGNFWRTTVTDLLDSDRVDVAASGGQVSQMKFGVPFKNALMLFAPGTQFSLNVTDLLTPSSVSLDPVTSYDMNVRARPVGIGSDVYFVTESGSYSRVREYFADSSGGSNAADADDVTAHVPKYVPSGVFKLAGNTNEDVLFAISDNAGERHRIYVYKFFWNGDDKAQSAWSYWEHGDDDSEILSISTLENDLYVLVNRPSDGVYLEKCNLQIGATTGALDLEVLLDRLDECTGVYSGGTLKTTWTLPYVVAAGQQANFRLIRGADFDVPGSRIDDTTIVWNSTTSVTINGDHSDGEVHVGLKYTKSHTFSEQFIRKGGSSGEAVTTGRQQLRTITLYFTDTAYFATSVAPYGTDPLVEEIVTSGLSAFTGKTLGEAQLLIGVPTFLSGTYSFQVYGNTREAVVTLTNDSHLQSKFQSAEIELFSFNRAMVR